MSHRDDAMERDAGVTEGAAASCLGSEVAARAATFLRAASFGLSLARSDARTTDATYSSSVRSYRSLLFLPEFSMLLSLPSAFSSASLSCLSSTAMLSRYASFRIRFAKQDGVPERDTATESPPDSVAVCPPPAADPCAVLAVAPPPVSTGMASSARQDETRGNSSANAPSTFSSIFLLSPLRFFPPAPPTSATLSLAISCASCNCPSDGPTARSVHASRAAI
mmetsp:Transcript_53479/g.160030  ORF Transcript_53479/g.160030 Transcript_53479/m.160030 type:complete len:223 (+) Transcript_53479:1585-2253(+)